MKLDKRQKLVLLAAAGYVGIGFYEYSRLQTLFPNTGDTGAAVAQAKMRIILMWPSYLSVKDLPSFSAAIVAGKFSAK